MEFKIGRPLLLAGKLREDVLKNGFDWTGFFFLTFIYLFMYLFLAVLGPRFLCEGFPPAAASRGHSSSRCAGLPPSRPLLLRSTGSRRAGSVVVAHGPSCSAARGTLPDQGSNPRPPHRQADSQPLRHQGSPKCTLLRGDFCGV